MVQATIVAVLKREGLRVQYLEPKLIQERHFSSPEEPYKKLRNKIEKRETGEYIMFSQLGSIKRLGTKARKGSSAKITQKETRLYTIKKTKTVKRFDKKYLSLLKEIEAKNLNLAFLW